MGCGHLWHLLPFSNCPDKVVMSCHLEPLQSMSTRQYQCLYHTRSGHPYDTPDPDSSYYRDCATEEQWKVFRMFTMDLVKVTVTQKYCSFSGEQQMFQSLASIGIRSLRITVGIISCRLHIQVHFRHHFHKSAHNWVLYQEFQWDTEKINFQ